ncbi:MAG: aminoacetone oxidase family FAD-binding enzyme, partial [Patescibacteria group bacterium]
ERSFDGSRVHVMLKPSAVGVDRLSGGGFAVRFKNDADLLEADNVVLTTGGQAYRHTGSTGDGYAFAISLGHSLTPLAPSLNAFFTREKWPAEISGLSFERATITARRGKGIKFTGPLLFTHRGVSGPAVFALSSLVAFERYDYSVPLEIAIDLFPDLSIEALRKTVEEHAATNPAKSFLNMISGFVPKSLAEICVREADLPGAKRSAEVSKKDMLRTVAWLKAIPLRAVQRGAGDEFVTAGGVLLSEVDPRTMESKVCPGLYFAGEILDIDGYTGGFNLQASWATGHLAGSSIATKRVKNCILIHGCPDNAEKAMDPKARTYDKHWIPWTKKRLIAKGIKTETPQMPKPWQPEYGAFKKEFEKYPMSENTVLVGHSCGCAFLVRWLGESKRKAAKLILVAPWKIPPEDDELRKDFYTYPIDKTIASRVREIVMFSADDEEDDGKKSLDIFHRALGGKIIELKGRGHYTLGDMGTDAFPELLDEVIGGK